MLFLLLMLLIKLFSLKSTIPTYTMKYNMLDKHTSFDKTCTDILKECHIHT